mgnify:CR=1 FL=1
MSRSRHRDSCSGSFLPCRHLFLYHRVPLSAGRASAHPFRTFISAFLAEPNCLCLYRCHLCSYYSTNLIERFFIRPNRAQKKDIVLFRTISRQSGRTACNVALITQPCCSQRKCCRTERTLSNRSTPLRKNLPSGILRTLCILCTLLQRTPLLPCCYCKRKMQQRTLQLLLP